MKEKNGVLQGAEKLWDVALRGIGIQLPDESCGTWQRRADNQPPVRFPRAVQLELFK